MTRVAIVGGGLSGLSLAMFLKDHCEVMIVEKSPNMGGLLSSTELWGIPFDWGTHIIRETGVEAIDELLFSGITEEHWNQFRMVKAGSCFNGQVNAKSPFIDLGTLPPSLQIKARAELFNEEQKLNQPSSTLYDHSLSHFGSTITEHIVRPAINKQLQQPLEKLSPNTPFFMPRVVINDPELIRKKANDPEIDARVAYPSYEMGIGEINNYYPKVGGVGRFIDLLTSKLQKEGVNLYCDSQVSGLTLTNSQVTHLEINETRLQPVDALVWTIPSFPLASLLNITVEPLKGSFTKTNLHHFVFHNPLKRDNHFITNYDPTYSTFRVTLYPNLGAERPMNLNNLTVEQIDSGDRISRQDIYQELVNMGVIDENNTIKNYCCTKSPSGFPAFPTDYFSKYEVLHDHIRSEGANIHLIGKAKGIAFFMADIIKEAHQAASLLC
jgi:protoporphyrinogen oxidase